MVWINTEHFNSFPRGRNDEPVFGGAMCICNKCADERVSKQEKESKSFYKECIA